MKFLQMPRKSRVPGCKSNYYPNEQHISTFKFPKDDLLCKTWISKINEKDFVPGSCACVCISHFVERFIIRDDIKQYIIKQYDVIAQY
ncbi:hypothetical protein X975_20819, partial [Stegodyphus mimosarum]